MKRSFPRVESDAVAISNIGFLLIPALAVSLAACEPDNKVKPGAPVLMSLSLLEASGTRTDITPDVGDCDTGTKEGDDCDPAGSPCRLDTTICHCVAKAEGDCS